MTNKKYTRLRERDEKALLKAVSKVLDLKPGLTPYAFHEEVQKIIDPALYIEHQEILQSLHDAKLFDQMYLRGYKPEKCAEFLTQLLEFLDQN